MVKLSNAAKKVKEDLKKIDIPWGGLNPEVRLFLHGVKPAISRDLQSRLSTILVENYPSIVTPRDRGVYGTANALIFQDAYRLYEYTQKTYVSESYMYEHDNGSVFDPCLKSSCADLGITLGYPPSACEWFAEDLKNDVSSPDRLVIYYHGMQFVTHKSLVAENIKWLRDNRPVPESIQNEEYVRSLYSSCTNWEEFIHVSFDEFLSSSLHQG
ncbi:hypothetical protein 000TH008_46 [Bacillus phage 000TH008]|nr:hypothetical protein 000TH008_46 [Bacillus phage 000TH008]QQO40740.1 hypothetical protein 000TH009_46 [Bacillus phage 000TH009]